MQNWHLSTPSHPWVPPEWPYCWQAQCGHWFTVKWSLADLLTSSHPQMSASHLLGLQVRANGPSWILKVLSLNQLPDLFIDMHGWLWRIKGNFDPNGIPIEFSGSNFGDMLATVDFFVSLGMLIIIISLEREFWSTFNTSETPTMKKCEVFEGSWK